MKKLMIAAAIVCVAVASQAASINWSHSESINAYDAGKNMLTAEPTDCKLVLAYLGTSDSWSYSSAVSTGAEANWDIGNEEGETWAANSGSYGNKSMQNGEVYAVMIQDDKGKLSQITYLDGTLNEEVLVTSGIVDERTSLKFTMATKDYVVSAGSAAPEPTSGLLLLLGMAGLALRRRRA